MTKFLRHIITVLALAMSPMVKADAPLERMMFERVDSTLGLGDNRVYHILQITDGRIAVTTHKNICVYDGLSFQNIDLDKAPSKTLQHYQGACHSYNDSKNRLWIKDYKRVKCLDIAHLRFVSNIDSILRKTTRDNVIDLFVGQDGTLWCETDKGQFVSDKKAVLNLPKENGELQDIVSEGDALYLFFSNTSVVRMNTKTGKEEYNIKATDNGRYGDTSLVIYASNGKMYQLRNDNGGGVCLCFDPKARQWSTLLETGYLLHTLSADRHHVYITSPEALWQIDTKDNEASMVESIAINGTQILPKHMNTIFIDRQGGVWTGSYANGLLYSHPTRTMVDAAHAIDLESYADAQSKGSTDYTLTPLLTSVHINGIALVPNSRQLPATEACTRTIHTDSKNDNVTLTFTAMNYPRQRNTYYLVNIPERDDDWHSPTELNGNVSNGILTLPVTCGDDATAHIRVAAFPSQKSLKEWIRLQNGNVKITEVCVYADVKWWAHTTLLFIALIIAIHLLLPLMLTKDKNEKNDEEPAPVPTDEKPSVKLPAADQDFIDRATEFVEKNISTKGYSVEQLATDMCMERTGLYKKLSSTAGTTPSNFIRNIRLEKAKRLLNEGKYSMNEIAEMCGFSSSSHMSKCFQSECGCTPSEYAKKCAAKQ
ncbi:MAG: helix-turn-helix transcriptional regulator [Bacteroidaceae bacterium]|nr:helix-turn-helix transcriptional regulator [Bacteroidaceae bacterium]